MEPTPEGKRRYADDAGHYRPARIPETRLACRCTESCAHPCLGRCGCAACLAAFEDWDSFGRLHQADGP